MLKIEEIEKAKNGNVKAFERIIEEYKVYLYNIAISILNNEEDAGDALSETIIKTYKYIRKLKKNEYVKTWITRILINECKKILKKSRKEKIESYEEYKDKNIEIENSRENLEETITIKEAIKSLKKEFRDVVILFYYNEMKLADIAKILKIPEGTVKSRLSSAKEKLYKILEDRRYI